MEYDASEIANITISVLSHLLDRTVNAYLPLPEDMPHSSTAEISQK